MLGRRDPQRSLFDAQSMPHRVPADSFHGRMGSVNGVLFSDDDLAMMYCPDNGRPSIPPSLLAGRYCSSSTMCLTPRLWIR